MIGGGPAVLLGVMPPARDDRRQHHRIVEHAPRNASPRSARGTEPSLRGYSHPQTQIPEEPGLLQAQLDFGVALSAAVAAGGRGGAWRARPTRWGVASRRGRRP